jgi:hypothetical protein
MKMKAGLNKILLLLLMISSMFLVTCRKPEILIHADGRGTLSPARQIAGTWTSFSAITVSELTNCNSSSPFIYASFQSTFTFIITPTDASHFDVAISGSAKHGLTDNCGQAPPLEYGYPLNWTGSVSSSAVSFIDHIYAKNASGSVVPGDYVVGNFTMTSDILSGTIYWLQYYSSLDCIGWQTAKITLRRQ